MQRNIELIAHYLAGASIRETAKKFGISRSRVHQILQLACPKKIRPLGDTRSNSTGLTSYERAHGPR